MNFSKTINKPFRLPLLRKTINATPSVDPELREDRPTKRRCIDLTEDNVKQKDALSHGSNRDVGAVATTTNTARGAFEGYYTVLWRKPTVKKHKSWTGDGYLMVTGGYARLRDISGKELGKSKFDGPLLHGSSLSVAGNEVEVDSVIIKEEFLRCAPQPSIEITKEPNSVPQKAPRVVAKEPEPEPDVSQRPLNVAAPKSIATKTHFKNPLLGSTVLPKQDGPTPTPRHDPKQAGALVMTRPKCVPKGKQIVDVVVDPLLSRHLRAHQREGVRFLYDCVMGQRPFDGEGAILADEMGLGKTLQTITLLWTLLKQNPIYDDPPVIKKALIVCPATLISNWRKEFIKWLGNERIGVFVADGSKRLRDFTLGKSYSVMIIGYEKLRNVQEELQEGTSVDIVVADEGHRLKTAQNKSAQAIKSLHTSRRIILSGTPIQNDLSEFYIMVELVNPGILGTYNSFKKAFEVPIVKSRQPDARKKDIQKGATRSEELSALTNLFILRRTADVIYNYLPAKSEYILLCRPTKAQIDAYHSVLSSPMFSSILGSSEASLQLITLLKKVCNAPSLVNRQGTISTDEEGQGTTNDLLLNISPSIVQSTPNSASAKLQVLGRLLTELRNTTQEKIVLVSNYTSTLDLLQQHLIANELSYLRLDGSTPSSKRQDLVDSFNKTSASTCFAFLLSAKAGGVGLNLIGASRLVLFDIDWNPSTDLQAMARIHRDGQKRDVRIYRLLMAGGLDEKIWQRQITKMGLADSVMDQKMGASSFSLEELRDLFTLDTTSVCQTHDLLGCPCGGRGGGETDTAIKQETSGRVTDTINSSDTEEEEEGEEDDEDLPELGSLIKASQVDMELQERRIKRRRIAGDAQCKQGSKKTSKMQSLMQYVHIDTSSFGGTEAAAEEEMEADDVQLLESKIDDDVLLSVLAQKGNRVKFVFAKTSSPDTPS
ncbi:MAG: helicase [Peltula sp. TS41687]|nr:MAG: helicase [Peltula sp. TS41687]